MGKKREAARFGGRFVGSAVVGGLVLTGVRRLPDFAGPYQGAADKLIAGGLMKLAKRGPSNAFLKVGIAEGFATAMDTMIIPLLSSRLNLGSLLGGSTQSAQTRNVNPLAVTV